MLDDSYFWNPLRACLMKGWFIVLFYLSNLLFATFLNFIWSFRIYFIETVLISLISFLFKVRSLSNMRVTLLLCGYRQTLLLELNFTWPDFFWCKVAFGHYFDVVFMLFGSFIERWNYYFVCWLTHNAWIIVFYFI